MLKKFMILIFKMKNINIKLKKNSSIKQALKLFPKKNAN